MPDGRSPNGGVTDVFQRKHARILSGSRPRLLDLFCGCGGFSLGFHRAGFKIVGGIDIDPQAATSHAYNFHEATPRPDGALPLSGTPADLLTLEPADAAQAAGHLLEEDAFDILIGGPPCQSYARVGRAKLREVANHPEAFRIDPRGNLYLRYLHYVRALKPLVIVMENVPDALNYGGHNVAEETAEALEELGYQCAYTLLNSVFYGVPQTRERMFLIACHRSIGTVPSFPPATHHFNLPRGYLSTRRVATNLLSKDEAGEHPTRYVPPPPPNSRNCKTVVTAREALEDLPVLTDHRTAPRVRGRRDLYKAHPYRSPDKTWFHRESAFRNQMRSWPSFESEHGVTGHVTRHLPRDYDIFEAMAPGDQYPEARKKAEQLFRKRLRELAASSGKEIPEGSKTYNELWAKTVPPYDPAKFPNKWRKIRGDEPARTLMAHLGKDSYSHIHYDDEQARTITVREAARLQSFPDGFWFAGGMNAAFRQIGNAVPPILAFRLAEHIMRTILKPR